MRERIPGSVRQAVGDKRPGGVLEEEPVVSDSLARAVIASHEPLPVPLREKGLLQAGRELKEPGGSFLIPQADEPRRPRQHVEGHRGVVRRLPLPDVEAAVFRVELDKVVPVPGPGADQAVLAGSHRIDQVAAALRDLFAHGARLSGPAGIIGMHLIEKGEIARGEEILREGPEEKEIQVAGNAMQAEAGALSVTIECIGQSAVGMRRAEHGDDDLLRQRRIEIGQRRRKERIVPRRAVHPLNEVIGRSLPHESTFIVAVVHRRPAQVVAVPPPLAFDPGKAGKRKAEAFVSAGTKPLSHVAAGERTTRLLDLDRPAASPDRAKAMSPRSDGKGVKERHGPAIAPLPAGIRMPRRNIPDDALRRKEILARPDVRAALALRNREKGQRMALAAHGEQGIEAPRSRAQGRDNHRAALMARDIVVEGARISHPPHVRGSPEGIEQVPRIEREEL